MRDLPHLAGRLFGTPLLIDVRKLDAIVPAFIRRLEGDPDDTGGAQPARSSENSVSDRVAVVRAIGTLIRRKTFMDAYSGLCSYGDIAAAVRTAMEDPRVGAVMLEVDSFGGEAAGCFELCDQLYAYRGRKPIWAVANVDSLSAGYAILAQADRTFVAPSGSAGSIGAVAIHCERSQMNEALGLTYTVIRAGLRKAELNTLEPLTKAAAEKVQTSLDLARQKFINSVVRARPGLTARAARATEAQWYQAEDAVKQKLVDAISTFDDAFAELAASVRVSSIATPPPPAPAPPVEDDEDGPENPEEKVMDPKDNGGAAAGTATPPTPAPAPPAAAAAPPAVDNVVALDGARAEGRAAFAAEVKEISELCQLAGKPALAAEFMAAGKSLAEVRKALVDAKAAEDAKGGELSNHNTRTAQKVAAAEVSAGWDKAFANARAMHG